MAAGAVVGSGTEVGAGAWVAAGSGTGADTAVAWGTGVTSWAVVLTGAVVGEGSSPQAATRATKEAIRRTRNNALNPADSHGRFNPALPASSLLFTSDCKIVFPLLLILYSIPRTF